ncbi:NAD-binding protein, partial [Streptomyces sp. NPDC051940]|uniref:potassium channel family protein n=1 Tax=Streptomyces sp. NPDC051940 TaxID=3155675 RepID=UPI0034303FE9
MVVCGDDALAERIAAELTHTYGQQVRLVQEEPDDRAFAGAGVRRAAALALVYDDDQRNVDAALRARRLNPRLRLVIRLYNRRLGGYLEQLLDRAGAPAAGGQAERQAADASTTVLSDADTAAPALVAAAVAGTSKVVQADGVMLRAAERPPGEAGRPRALCTLAVLRGAGGTPVLLPSDEEAEGAGQTVVALEAVTPAVAPVRAPWRPGRVALPLRTLFSARLRWSLAGVVLALGALSVAGWLTGQGTPLHVAYQSLLDLFAINDPAVGQPASRKALQLLSGLMGLLLLPVLVAAAIEALGTFRTASALRRPPRGLSGHVVLLGLGKIGSRVLAGLRERGIPVVCVEADPQARGVALARRLHVPTVIGDVTQDEVLQAAKIRRASAILAVTSDDSTNLEAVLGSRAENPTLTAVLRLADDQFATAVYRTLRDSHPGGVTRSRSVSALAAPAFAGAMMGRQILGAIPVERQVLTFVAVDASGHPELEGRTVAEAFRPGAWRILALDVGGTEGHFHYVVFGTVVFAMFAGFHFWWPKMTGKML